MPTAGALRRFDQSADLSDEIAARRAVSDVAEQVLRDGGTPEQADAMQRALQHYLLGHRDAARAALETAFTNGAVAEILDGFELGIRER